MKNRGRRWNKNRLIEAERKKAKQRQKKKTEKKTDRETEGGRKKEGEMVTRSLAGASPELLRPAERA